MTVWVKPPWLVAAEKEIGVAEIPGPDNNPRILEYWKIGDIERENPAHNELTSWCGAFIAAMMKLGGVEPWGDASARSWGSGMKARPLVGGPVYGCIGVKKRSGPNALAWQGHVGIVVAVSPDGKWVCMLGGNQSDKVGYAWFKAEDYCGSVNLGFFWPKTLPLPNVRAVPRVTAGSTIASKES